MYSESIRKANEAIRLHNLRADRAVADIGLAVFQSLYSINKTYPGLLPLIDVRNDGTDIRTGFRVETRSGAVRLAVLPPQGPRGSSV